MLDGYENMYKRLRKKDKFLLELGIQTMKELQTESHLTFCSQ